MHSAFARLLPILLLASFCRKPTPQELSMELVQAVREGNAGYIRELIAGILQDEGYQTRLAHNSDAAIAAIADRRPSLVVLDI
ncbi:MAG: hypothetical protein N2Z22_05365, partial [Turneriella sp.]|nr:hypothetical protein [Turneriella sp.]